MLETSHPTTTTCQVRFGGVGGQGIVMAGMLLGKAAALFDGKEAVCTRTYGPEARGGASRTDVIISNRPVDYPFVTQADVLAVLFQEAYVKFRTSLKPGGTLIIDTGLVTPLAEDRHVCGLPATKIAEELGSRIATNIVVLGYVIGKTGVVSVESARQAIAATVKRRALEMDLQALDAGLRHARDEATQ